ncbi:MAG: IclR family transcriptional regulator [Spirochaetia bacterium]|nr:IclR family transcriptional regulator [Spirochaetia bacterium]MCF7940694.1 IclR family transcriptional regulator [Spirochaetia bacterium]
MSSKYQVPVLEKTFRVIEIISKHPDGIPFIDIVNTLQEPKSTIFRILHTLVEHNWIEKTRDQYTLGFMFIHYGLTTLSRKNLRTVARPVLERLTAQTHQTSHITVLSGTRSMMLDVCDSTSHIKLPSQIGSLLPLYCTSHGKLFLAYSIKAPLEEALKDEEMVARTPNTITSIPELERELDRIRSRGYAIDELEYYSDIRCLAAPVWGPDGICIAAVGITATASSFTRDMIGDYAEIILASAQQISREMGHV